MEVLVAFKDYLISNDFEISIQEERRDFVYFDHPSTYDGIVRVPFDDIPKVIKVLQEILNDYGT